MRDKRGSYRFHEFIRFSIQIFPTGLCSCVRALGIEQKVHTISPPGVLLALAKHAVRQPRFHKVPLDLLRYTNKDRAEMHKQRQSTPTPPKPQERTYSTTETKR